MLRDALVLTTWTAQPATRILDPLERTSEILFGVIMVLTFTSSISVAESGHAETREVLVAALGCNVAWGIVDAAFYLMIHVEDMRGRTDERYVLDLLEASNVLVVHGSGFGSDPAAGYFRLVYLADEELLGSAFDRIERAVRARTTTV